MPSPGGNSRTVALTTFITIGASNLVPLFRGAPRRARRRPCVGAVRSNSTAGVVRTLGTLMLQPTIGADSWISTQERPQVHPTPAPLRHRHAFFAPFFTDRLPRDHAHPSLDSPTFARRTVSMPCYRSMVGNRVPHRSRPAPQVYLELMPPKKCQRGANL